MLDVQWYVEAFHAHGGDRSGDFRVEDGPDGVPTWDARPRLCFVPFRGAEPLGTGQHDPPIHWSGTVRAAFVAAFGDRFGDPRIVEGRNGRRFDHWRPYVVYALAGPGEG